MNKLTHKTLIEGEIYKGHFYNGANSTDHYVIVALGKDGDYRRDTICGRINENNEIVYWHINGALEAPRFTIDREATSKEKKHMRACIKAGKLVKCPNIVIIPSLSMD